MSTATARGRCRAGIDFDAAAAAAAELVAVVADVILFKEVSDAGCKGGGAAGLFAERCAKHERSRPRQTYSHRHMHTHAPPSTRETALLKHENELNISNKLEAGLVRLGLGMGPNQMQQEQQMHATRLCSTCGDR
jgi:hypothetical protein